MWTGKLALSMLLAAGSPDRPADPLAQTLHRQLGLDARHELVLQKATLERGEGGLGHRRYRQTYRGVPVLRGRVIAHLNARGQVLAVTDRAQRGLDLPIEPAISAEVAVDQARRELETKVELASQVDLVIETDFVKEVTKTGLPPGPEDAARNAQEIRRRATGHWLAYRVRLGAANPGEKAPAMEYLIDARDGTVRRQRSLVSYAKNQGRSEYSGTVSLDVTPNGPCGRSFMMVDPIRNGNEIRLSGMGTNVFEDFSGVWGDGRTPATYYQSDWFACPEDLFKTNAQTAAVDGAHGLQVVWDMFFKVFNQRGWDDDDEYVAVYVHDPDTSSSYNSFTENIYLAHGNSWWNPLGDTPHTTVDVVAHEFTHGVDDHLGEKEEHLKEGVADIFGALAKIYFRRGGFAAGSDRIPATSNMDDFVMFDDLQNWGVRKLYRPSLSGGFDSYFPDIDDEEVHDSGTPLGRAFYLLSQGASPFVDWSRPGQRAFASNTPHLTWGMEGIGTHKAARILYHTAFGCNPTDYAEVRSCAVLMAETLFGFASDESRATKNAFAGINVGSTAANYPADPVVGFEQEPNESGVDSPDLLSFDSEFLPEQGQRVFKAMMMGAMGSAGDEDTFKMTGIPCGSRLGIRLQPSLSDLTVRLFDAARNPVVPTEDSGFSGEEEIISFTTPSCSSAPGNHTFFVKVRHFSGMFGALYVLLVDRY